MSESKHTPGPWVVHRPPHVLPFVINEQRTQLICERVYNSNATLIAAAPDLLAALENLLAEFDRYDAAMTEIGRGHEDYGGQRDAARVVIAKARREST